MYCGVPHRYSVQSVDNSMPEHAVTDEQAQAIQIQAYRP